MYRSAAGTGGSFAAVTVMVTWAAPDAFRFPSTALYAKESVPLKFGFGV
jgi:hypothetical protein